MRECAVGLNVGGCGVGVSCVDKGLHAQPYCVTCSVRYMVVWCGVVWCGVVWCGVQTRMHDTVQRFHTL